MVTFGFRARGVGFSRIEGVNPVSVSLQRLRHAEKEDSVSSLLGVSTLLYMETSFSICVEVVGRVTAVLVQTVIR